MKIHGKYTEILSIKLALYNLCIVFYILFGHQLIVNGSTLSHFRMSVIVGMYCILHSLFLVKRTTAQYYIT